MRSKVLVVAACALASFESSVSAEQPGEIPACRHVVSPD